jgi:putative oxidoreductase
MRQVLQNRWILMAVRVALGALFIYSAWPKIADPPAFAQVLSNYRLLPGALVNPAALVLPWLEMVAGICLVAGIMRRAAALWITVLLVVFMGALAINIARDVAVDCGCFSVTASQKSHAELITSMKLDVVRDLGMLLMALFTLFFPLSGSDPENIKS